MMQHNKRKLIIHIEGGTTSQLLNCYAGYIISKDTNRELILDISSFDNGYHFPYALDAFGIDFKKLKYQWKSTQIFSETCVSNEYINEMNPTFIEMKISLRETLELCKKHDDKETIHLVGDNVAIGCNEHFEEFSEKYKPNYKLLFLDKFKEKIKGRISVGVYARRGEYLKYGWASGFEFFKAGINYFNEKYKDVDFYIFSDNLEEVKENLGNYSNFHYVKFIGGADAHIEALYALASCTHSLVGNTLWSHYIVLLNNKETAEHVRLYDEYMPHFVSFSLKCTGTIFKEEDIIKYLNTESNINIKTQTTNVSEKIEVIKKLMQESKHEQAMNEIVDISLDSFDVTLQQRDELTMLFEKLCINTGELLRAEQSLIEHRYANPESLIVNANLAIVKAKRNKMLQSLFYAIGTVKLDKTGNITKQLSNLFETTNLKPDYKFLSTSKKMHFIFINTYKFSFFTMHKDGLISWLSKMGHKVSILDLKFSDLGEMSSEENKIKLSLLKAPYKSDSNIDVYALVLDRNEPEMLISQVIGILSQKIPFPAIIVNRNFNFGFKAKNLPLIYWDFSQKRDNETEHILESNNSMEDIDKHMCQYSPYVITTDERKVDFFKGLVGDKVFLLDKYATAEYTIDNEIYPFDETQISNDQFLKFVLQFLGIADYLTDE